ncbi:MAG: hypothetical protein DRJ52_10000 [Thermoprotei archaeon]|nr:MAG: hypothetical protein DRJ52_10000 [Thermoprotei archaeon]
MEEECDVLVVGAGPAGSSAARAAARAGAKTILIDKKEEIGVPVQCAEAIGKYLFPFLPFKIPKEQLVWKIDGMTFWTEDVQVERRGVLWAGYAIDRKNFDKWLASLAVNAGAKLFTSAELVDMELGDGYHVEKAFVRTPHGIMTVKPKVVIAADGVESTVIGLLGLKPDSKEGLVGEIMSFEMRNLDLEMANYEHIFVGSFAPGSYGYIFPKSKRTANVGVGALLGKKKLEKCYEEFLEIPQVKKQIKNAVVVEEKSGLAPFLYITNEWTYGNVLLTGDAANQNFKPFVEGILPGVICGDIAGRSAYEYIARKAPLNFYERNVNKKLGHLFKESDELISIMYHLSESSRKSDELLLLGICTNLFPTSRLSQLKELDHTELRKKIESWSDSRIRKILTRSREKLDILYSIILSKVMTLL